ncbi:hypothetical protein B484DRAFT_483492, partial [Ochromonadaceae sp. CCMP2298]
MKVSPGDLAIWILLPVLNFLLFVHIGSLSNPPCSSRGDAMEELLHESLQELQQEEQCEHAQTQCATRIQGHTNLTLHETFAFEKWRSERLATMDMDLLLDTYVRDSMTGVLQRFGDAECTSYDQHLIKGKEDSCFAVAYVGNTDRPGNVVRTNQDVDHYGLSISNPDKAQVPKENGRLRTKQKLGTFLTSFRQIEEDYAALMKERGFKKGDDVVVM